MFARITVLLALLLFSACGTSVPVGDGQMSNDIAVTGPAELEQLIYETGDTGDQRLIVRTNIGSREDLLKYRDMKVTQAARILEETRDRSQERPYYPVVVTMRRPVSLPELNRLIGRYNPTTAKAATKLLEKNVKALPKVELVKDVDMFIVDQVKFVSTTGGGQFSYETLSDPAGLARLEAKLAAREMKYNNVDNYQLIKGVTSIRGGIHRDRLMGMEEEPDVFLADIGPKELYDGTVPVALWEDVYGAVAQFTQE